MPVEQNIWQEIKNRLSELKKNETLAFFSPLLETLEDKLMQVASLPEAEEHYKILKALIGLFNKILIGIQTGKSPIDVWNEVTRVPEQKQDNWDVLGDVFQPTGHLFQFYLGDFQNSLKIDKPSEPILLPIVLVVMDKREAQELESQIINNSFTYIPSDLKNLLVNDWTQRYQANPKLWQPFSGTKGAVSIKQLMEKALNCIDCCKSPLKPDFLDIRTLNRPEKRVQLNWLRQNGCIAIADIVSMAHLKIQNEFMQSGLNFSPKTLIASIPPIPKELEVIQKTISVVEQYTHKEFHQRFNIDFDSKCARVSSDIDINRWIKEQIPKILPDDLKHENKQGIANNAWLRFEGGKNQ